MCSQPQSVSTMYMHSGSADEGFCVIIPTSYSHPHWSEAQIVQHKILTT